MHGVRKTTLDGVKLTVGDGGSKKGGRNLKKENVWKKNNKIFMPESKKHWPPGKQEEVIWGVRKR